MSQQTDPQDPARPVAPRPGVRKGGIPKGVQIGLAMLTVAVGLGWLLTSTGSGEGSFRYYQSVAEFASEGSARSSRVHGFVLEGSITKNLPAGHVDFAIRDEVGGVLPVRLDGIEVPDLFGDGAEVVVEGRLDGDRFVAQRVLAKCPSKYEAEPGATGPEA
jgi:cytochrome c-type biogenesis protein CcmE